MTPMRLAPVLAIVLACGCSNQDVQLQAMQQRIQQLEDQEQIRRVLIEYGEHLDSRDYAAYAALFASDGVWTGGFGSFTGPAAIQQMLEQNLGRPEPGFINKRSFHLVTTEVVDVTGDTAVARSRYLFITATPEDRPGMSLAGRYVDEFVREEGQWKIKGRTSHGVIPWRDGDAPPPPSAPASAPAPAPAPAPATSQR